MKKLTCIALASLCPLVLAASRPDLASLLVPIAELAPARPEAQPVAQPVQQVRPTAAPEAPQAQPRFTVYLEDVLLRLRTELEARFAPEGGLELRSPQSWRDIPLSSPDWSLELVRVAGQQLASRTVVTFRILSEGRSIGEYQLALDCVLKRDVFVTKKYLGKGNSPGEGDLELQSRDILDMSVKPVPAGTDISGMELRNAVGAGQVLYWRDIQARPILRRGQVVEATASEGGLRITVKALVLEDGREGDFISVRNLASKKDIQARILDERTVQVYF